MFDNKYYKYYYYVAAIIGILSLIGSFYTIFNNLKNEVGIYFALVVPFSVDLLIIYLSFSIMSFIHLGKKSNARVYKIISYILMIGSIYLNNLNSVHTASIVAHSFVVCAWIICTEILVSYAKESYKQKLEKSKFYREINELKQEQQRELIMIEHNKQKNKLLEDTIIKKEKELNIKLLDSKLDTGNIALNNKINKMINIKDAIEDIL